MRLVLVSWLDHCESDGEVWQTTKQAGKRKAATVHSVGWLVRETEDRLVLSSSTVEGEDLVARPLVLVKAAVTRVEDLSRR